MCCVLWDLCVCFCCQDRIYISDENKRFSKSTVTLCTKHRMKFYLPSLRQRTSVPYSSPAAGGTAQHDVGGTASTGMVTLHSGSVQCYLCRLCVCHRLISVKYPQALWRAAVHPETRNVGFGSPCLLGPVCHTCGLLHTPSRVASVSAAGTVS